MLRVLIGHGSSCERLVLVATIFALIRDDVETGSESVYSRDWSDLEKGATPAEFTHNRKRRRIEHAIRDRVEDYPQPFVKQFIADSLELLDPENIQARLLGMTQEQPEHALEFMLEAVRQVAKDFDDEQGETRD